MADGRNAATAPMRNKELVFLDMSGKEAESIVTGLGLRQGNVPVSLMSAHEADKKTVAGAGRLVAIYQSGLPFLANQMQQGVAPSTALQEWKEAATALLHIIRPLRGKILIVDLERSVRAMPAFHTRLSEWTGWTFPPLDPSVAAPAPTPASAFYLLASEVLKRSASARRLQAELDVSGHPFGDEGAEDWFAPDALFQSLVKRQNAPQEEAELREMELQQAQDEIDALRREVKVQSQDLVVAREEIDALQRTVTDHQHHMNMADAHIKDGTAQITQLSQALQHARSGAAQNWASTEAAVSASEEEVLWLQGELEDALKQIEALHHLAAARGEEITSLRESTSWKITGPARTIIRTLFPGRYRDD